METTRLKLEDFTYPSVTKQLRLLKPGQSFIAFCAPNYASALADQSGIPITTRTLLILDPWKEGEESLARATLVTRKEDSAKGAPDPGLINF